jgi:ribosomal silencing factor RsfS
VFDLEDILQVLRDERMKDICVIEIPPEQQYAQYLILATAFSARHLSSTSEYINKLVNIERIILDFDSNEY